MQRENNVIIGKHYNCLVPKERIENYVAKSGTVFSQYLCECDCGKTCKVLGGSLITGHTKSCGHLMRKPKVSDESMIGRRFGLLKVESRAPSHKVPSGSVYDMWNCTCECGGTTVSFGRNLRNGTTSSCGCVRAAKMAAASKTPKAELWFIDYLKEKQIGYVYQKTFPDLVGIRGGLLSYDFYIPDYNMLIELNGLQHYKSVDWFGGEKTFNAQQSHDELKRNYAESHNYNLVVIDTDHISKASFLYKIESLF